jgi:hypothetical protein
VTTCKNPKKSTTKEVYILQVPKEAVHIKSLDHQKRKGVFNYWKNGVICSDHFGESQYAIDKVN